MAFFFSLTDDKLSVAFYLDLLGSLQVDIVLGLAITLGSLFRGSAPSLPNMLASILFSGLVMILLGTFTACVLHYPFKKHSSKGLLAEFFEDYSDSTLSRIYILHCHLRDLLLPLLIVLFVE